MAEQEMPPNPRPLRLLMGPVLTVDHRRLALPDRIRFGNRFRWVTELNGHPGCCGSDCWHREPEAALRCFHGTSSDAMQS